MLVGTIEPNLDEFIYQMEDVNCDDSDKYPVICLKTICHLNCLSLGMPSPKLRKALTGGKPIILHTFTMIDGNNYKVIVDNGNCISSVSFKIIDKIALKHVPCPQPYKVS